MAYGGGDYLDITLPAAADLSTYQYKFVKVDANGRGTITANATDPILGILQNKPSVQDAPARIRIAGISKLVGGAALNEGDMLASTVQDATSGSANGMGTAAAAGQVGVFVGAICLAATGGSGDIADVLVTRFIL